MEFLFSSGWHEFDYHLYGTAVYGIQPDSGLLLLRNCLAVPDRVGCCSIFLLLHSDLLAVPLFSLSEKHFPENIRRDRVG